MTWDPDNPAGTRRSPTCSRCGTNTDIERLNRAIDGQGFWCAACNSTFSGSAEEWERMRAKRERYIAGFYEFKGWPDQHAETTT